MTSSSRALRVLAAGVVTGLSLTFVGVVAPAIAAPERAAVSSKVKVPSTPVITKTTGTNKHYARIDFKVTSSGGAKYTVIQARGTRWSGKKVVGHCDAASLKSKGSWIGYSPSGPGTWSFEIRVKNSAGWSGWSKQSAHVKVT